MSPTLQVEELLPGFRAGFCVCFLFSLLLSTVLDP
jgi:hypothetical protein